MLREPDTDGNTVGVERRAVLSMVAAGTAGLAGCIDSLSGGGGDGGGGDGGSDGGDPQPLDVPEGVADGDPAVCSPLVESGIRRYDESGSPFVATFEHPGDVVATATVNADHSLTIRQQIDGQPFDFFPTMNTEGTEGRTDAQTGDVSGLETVATVDYAGETLPVVRARGGSNGDDAVRFYKEYPYYVVGVPHEGSAGKRYYRYDFRATVEFADDLETGTCAATWERLARRMIASLEPNDDTTVGSG